MHWVGVLIEREASYLRDHRGGMIHRASIRLSYQRITARFLNQVGGAGEFVGSYSRYFNAVSLTSCSMSNGAVSLDLPG